MSAFPTELCLIRAGIEEIETVEGSWLGVDNLATCCDW